MKQDDRFKRSYDVQQIVERLLKLAVGETVEYAELDKLGGDNRSKVASARRIIQKENQIVTAAVAGVGIQRLADVEIVKTGATSVAKIRRESQRGMKRLGCVNYNELDNAAKAKHDAAASHLGVLAEFAKPKTIERISDAAAKKIAKLTLDETLAAFRSK